MTSSAPTHSTPRSPLPRLIAAGVVGIVVVGVLANQALPERTGSAPPVTVTPSPDWSPIPSPTPSSTSPAEPESLLAEHGVAAGHPLAVEAGMEILEAGGTAADAAVATAFAVSVVEPFASGIGGGGATLVATADGDAYAYDYREEVPLSGTVPSSGTGIPGFVAGMARLHDEHGALPWEDVLAPAARLAEEGFEVSEFLSVRMRAGSSPGIVDALPQFAPGGSALQAGQTLVQEDLAATIHALREDGPDSFYTGDLAARLSSAIPEVDAESLAAYEVIAAQPVRGDVGQHTMLGAPPALPGVAAIHMLQELEAGGIDGVDPDSAQFVRDVSSAWLSAENTVRTRLGDPRFNDLSVEGILTASSSESAAEPLPAPRAADIALASAESDGPATPPNTTHITVVDADGTVVSMTNTIMFFWGSGRVVDGYFLNNHLTRFADIPSALNQPGPGRRPVTWTNPMIVLDDQDRPVLGIGSPGGQQILNIMGNVLARWALLDQSLDDAVAAPRFRYNQSTGVLITEESLSDVVRSALTDSGWSIDVWSREAAGFGSVQALEIDYDTGTVTGAVDTRREADSAIVSVP